MTEHVHKMRFARESQDHKYNLIHFRFFVQQAKMAGIEVDMVESDDRVFVRNDQLLFSCTVDDQQIIVDYADHSTRNWKAQYPDVPYFKFQTTINSPDDHIPLGPPIVGLKRKGTKGATMREYNFARAHFKYQPGSRILCKQLPNGAALDRRNMVHDLLKNNFSDIDIDANTSQIDFWKMHETCLASVCVPGATNNMVDRGHMELLGLGVCTVSPELHTIFPYRKSLVPGKHYIKCADDYSDLVQILQDLARNPATGRRIGMAARKFYEKFFAAEHYWKWILRNLK